MYIRRMQDAQKTQSNPNDSLSYPVGKIKDAHGIRGELFVRLFAGTADWLDDFEMGYLVSPDKSEIQTIQVERVSSHKDGLILKVANISDRTPAEQLKGYQLEIPSELLIADEGEDIYMGEVVGFMMIDSTSGKSAKITGISSNTFQDLILVKLGGQEYMIPFVSDLIEKIDFAAKAVKMNLPLGLLGEKDIEVVGKPNESDADVAAFEADDSAGEPDDQV